MNYFKNIKVIGISVIVVICVLAGTWLHGYYAGIRHKQHDIDTTPTVTSSHRDSLAIPPHTITGNAHVLSSGQGAPVIPHFVQQLTHDIDTLRLILEDLAYENQQLREDLAKAEEPKYITIDNERVGKMLITYFPVSDTCEYTYTEPDRWMYVDTVTVIKTVQKDEDWSWTALKVGSGVAVGMIATYLLVK